MSDPSPEGRATAEWMAEHPVMARARLLTAEKYLALAAANTSQMIGYVDALLLDIGEGATRDLALGMDNIRSKLMQVVRALDMVPGPADRPTREPASPERPTPREIPIKK